MQILWVIAGIIAGGLVAYFVFGKKKEGDTKNDTGLQLILAQLNELARTVDSKLGESHQQVNESLKFHSSESNKIIRDVTERLTRLDETNKQVISFADQLQSLENILKNPKQRGILGEYYLETVLKNVLPPGSYQMQYAFPDGTIVDAVVFVKDKIIPIDSKFSLENYNKLAETRDEAEIKRLGKIFEDDLKNRILKPPNISSRPRAPPTSPSCSFPTKPSTTTCSPAKSAWGKKISSSAPPANTKLL